MEIYHHTLTNIAQENSHQTVKYACMFSHESQKKSLKVCSKSCKFLQSSLTSSLGVILPLEHVFQSITLRFLWETVNFVLHPTPLPHSYISIPKKKQMSIDVFLEEIKPVVLEKCGFEYWKFFI